MIQFIGVIGDYHTWTEYDGDTREHNRRRSALNLSGYNIRTYLDGDIGLWDFFSEKMSDACKRVGNNRGKLEKVIACIRIRDDSKESKHRTFYYIQENDSNLTYVIAQPDPVTRRDKAVTSYTEPLSLTAAHIRKTAPKILEFIKSKEVARA